MRATLLYDQLPAVDVDARAEASHLWVAPDDVARATGWALKPEGLCRDEACVPLPRDGSWRDADGRLDLMAFAQRLRRPIVADAARAVWAVGEPADARAQRLLSLEAPDFTLPDLDGRPHALADYRGRKIFLMAWGSY
jgi:hypothetical protein